MLACDAVQKRRIIAPSRKPVTLRAVRPNLGIAAEYQRRLDALIGEMQASLTYWMTAGYRQNLPRIGIVEDAAATAGRYAPASVLQRRFNRLSRRWQRQIDDAAPKLAAWFAKAATDRSDAALKKILKDGGFTVSFDPTPTTTDVFRATLNENVSLIKSVAAQHLADVEQIIMRSVSQGRGAGEVSKALQARYGVTKRRAALISRDQNNKATAAITRARQQQLGITEAIWQHSTAGKHPRPSHVAANGKRYEVAKGMYLDGVWTWPGVEINCRCVAISVVPALDDGRYGKQA
jgi:SPP1 gp7 family putative phage head morphogenesis protein